MISLASFGSVQISPVATAAECARRRPLLPSPHRRLWSVRGVHEQERFHPLCRIAFAERVGAVSETGIARQGPYVQPTLGTKEWPKPLYFPIFRIWSAAENPRPRDRSPACPWCSAVVGRTRCKDGCARSSGPDVCRHMASTSHTADHVNVDRQMSGLTCLTTFPECVYLLRDEQLCSDRDVSSSAVVGRAPDVCAH